MPGGCTSLLYLLFLLFYISWRIQLFFGHERDDYMMVSKQTSLQEREPLYFNQSSIDFIAIVHDEKFDNDDNPYGELRVVIYNSMNSNGSSEEQVVPLKQNCSKAYSEVNFRSTSKFKRYCPDFQDHHYLKNDYYSDKSAWMRLILYECDKTKRECASKSEINDYFAKTILELQINQVKPRLLDYESPQPTSSQYVHIHYSVRDKKDLVQAKEIFIRQS